MTRFTSKKISLIKRVLPKYEAEDEQCMACPLNRMAVTKQDLSNGVLEQFRLMLIKSVEMRNKSS